MSSEKIKVVLNDGVTCFFKNLPSHYKHLKFNEHDCYSIFAIFKLNNYLHNDNGPAVISLDNKTISYWLNGKHITDEKEIARIKFSKKLKNIIDD